MLESAECCEAEYVVNSNLKGGKRRENIHHLHDLDVTDDVEPSEGEKLAVRFRSESGKKKPTLCDLQLQHRRVLCHFGLRR